MRIGLYSMRNDKDMFLIRLADAAHRYGFTPNSITALGLCLGITCGVMLAFRAYPLAFTLGISSVFCDVLDGTIARRFRSETKFGLIFDSSADRLSELAVVLGALASGIILPLGSLAIIGSVTLLVFRTLSYSRGLSTNYVWFGRFERLVFMLFGLLSPLAWVSTLCFVVTGLLGLVSSLQIAHFLLQRAH